MMSFKEFISKPELNSIEEPSVKKADVPSKPKRVISLEYLRKRLPVKGNSK